MQSQIDVADVAYPVVSLGKMIESGFTFSFDDYRCYMHKGNQSVVRKGSNLRVSNGTQVVGMQGSNGCDH